ncbi:MAG TPA: FkbM family methyltransferase [Verrucomicrobiae bacterium]|nr:FkbM family methyltransferase [Verrucomicrobiae bacterium]
MTHRLKPGDVFIDVGANVGYFSCLASKLVGDSGKVVSIEALPQIFERLKENLAMNGAHNVRLANVAVWNKEENLKMFTRMAHPLGATSLMPAWAAHWQLETAVEVPAKPLPAILTQEEITRARLIKIDVEGAEWKVISGMADMLPDSRQDLEIIVEISRGMLKEQGKSAGDLLELFARHGFHPYRLINDYSVGAYVAPRIPQPPKRVETILDSAEDQMDVIFSRAGGASL